MLSRNASPFPRGTFEINAEIEKFFVQRTIKNKTCHDRQKLLNIYIYIHREQHMYIINIFNVYHYSCLPS